MGVVMAKEKLTQGRVSGFACPPEKESVFLWDTITQGFGLKASKGGGKVYIFQDKLNGKDIRITIGATSAWTIDKAREEARHLHTQIDRGIDPREDKRERIAAYEAKRADARRQEATVAEGWASYIEARKHKWSPRHLLDHEHVTNAGGQPRKRGAGMTEPGPLAALMGLQMTDLTAPRIEAWLKVETTKRPTYAALAYRLLRAFVRWSAGHPDYAAVTNLDAVGTRIAKDHVPSVRAKEGDCLQREQLKPWFDAVRKIGNPVISAYLQGLLLTGSRREELAGVKWADVDFQWKSLTIRDKVEGERTIPLTPYLASLFVALPRRNEWVFSSPAAASGRIQEQRISHVKALTAAGLPHVSLHGLRRSFGTLAEWVECPVGVVAQIQGHKPSAIAEKHYRRRPLDLLRMWHTRIEAWMLNEAGIESVQSEDSNVVPIRKEVAA